MLRLVKLAGGRTGFTSVQGWVILSSLLYAWYLLSVVEHARRLFYEWGERIVSSLLPAGIINNSKRGGPAHNCGRVRQDVWTN